MHNIRKGMSFSHTRTFTRRDILDFAEMSLDKGRHHTTEADRLLAHGLLVATLPTKIGGDLNYIAREMMFTFLGPVYEGDTITCTGHVDGVAHQSRRMKLRLSFQCINQHGDVVMRGRSSGFILQKSS